MVYSDKTIDQMNEDLRRVERERDSKGRKHPDYKHANLMIEEIRKAIAEKETE